MEKQSNTFLKSTMNYGLLLGLVLIVLTLIQYILDMHKPPVWYNILTYVAIILGIAYGTIKHRNDDLNGEISYGKAVGTGTMISLFGAIVSGFFFYLLITVIDPSFLESIHRIMEEALYEQGMPPDQIEQAMKMMVKFQSPIFLFITMVFGTTFFGVIFSLITSIFIKREKPIFDETTQRE